MDNIICERCENGTQTYDEDGRTVQDVCYHCGGTGRIDEELAESDALVAVADTLAHTYVQWFVTPPESHDEDGFDLQLAAAENMCSVSEYKKGMEMDAASEFAEEIAKLPHRLQRALKLALAPKPRKVAPIAAPVPSEPVETTPPEEAQYDLDADIPF